MHRRISSGIALGFVAGLAVAIACSARSMPGTDALVIRDVAADVAAEPPATSDRLRVRTADTDIDQQEEGETELAPVGPDVPVVAGPIILTDIWTLAPLTGSVLIISLHTKQTCDAEVTRPHIGPRNLANPAQLPLHGVRMAIRAGEFLCARSTGAFLQWSGYRPYPSS